ncbi:MAG TPA: pyridoxal phosphate-dependent aminotransferase family protein [Candidatus Limnocylindria bacterium]|nr:pyridoxal phosphate-dependent aminotransferase family protein [Candidatus Limnocylindria bacterium]
MPLAETLQQIDRTCVRYRGRKLLYFGGCDYFRMASHPEVLHALHEGADKFGLNVAASRLTTGNHVLFGQLEEELAKFFGVERAALLSNGYASNLAFTQSFAEHFTHALLDERSHGSPKDAAQFLRCSVSTFGHRDAQDFRRILKSFGRSARPLVLTDGMFSHDGSLAPLNEYLEALPKRGMLLVDDAHGAGTVGKTGRGTPEVCGVRDERLVQTISLSKAFGVYGGAVLGSGKVIETLQERSRIFTGNTPVPLPLANATLASIRILRRDPLLRARLRANTLRIKSALRAANLPAVENASPIVAITPKTKPHAARLSRTLLRAGIFPPLIRYPGGPRDGYFRFAISSEHTAKQLDILADVLIASENSKTRRH